MFRVVTAAATLVIAFGDPAMATQEAPPALAVTHRVFLASGEPLPSAGEPIFVGDRVIFNLFIGSTGSQDLQLISLPASGVDRDRTRRYNESIRAAHYAATRGESDHAALTAEVARVLDYLAGVADPVRRLALAEQARRNVLAWADDHYQYRYADVRELAALFEAVASGAGPAAGPPVVAFELIARPAPPEPALPAPTLREAIALSLAAAQLADTGADRLAVLRRARAAAMLMDDRAVTDTVSARLDDEVRVEAAYRALISALRLRAERARQRGEVAGVERVRADLLRQDARLGRRRPGEVAEFEAELTATLEATRAFRARLDDHARQLVDLRRYAGTLTPLMERFAQLDGVLAALRDVRGVTAAQLARADATLARLAREADGLRPPSAQVPLHTAFQSALRLGREAVVRRRQAHSSQANETREASAAAAGAVLLVGQVRRDLAAGLRRPTIQ